MLLAWAEPHRKYLLRIAFPRSPFLAATGAQLTSFRGDDEMMRTMTSAQSGKRRCYRNGISIMEIIL